MNTATKILFTDLDGTLLNDQHKVSDVNKNAMNQALLKGHKIVIATGRPLASAKILAKDLGLMGDGCYIIASNGAIIYDTTEDKVLASKSLSLKHLRYLFDCAYEDGFHIHTYSHTHVVSEKNTPELDWYTKTIKVPPMLVEDVTTYLPYDPVKAILIHFDGKDNLIQFQEKMASFTKDKFSSIFSNDMMLEYCPLNASKGNAVRDLCKLLDIPIENSYSAGDEQNDISMIQAAGTGCVMCNGSEETKRYADYITMRSNNEDGIAEIIEKFFL